MNQALLGMVDRLNNEESNGRQLWLPAELKTMSTWQQQDAQEYFSKILDKVDKEALKVAKQEAETEMKKELSLEKGQEKVPQPDGLKNPLEGMLGQRVACKSCKHSDGISLIPFNCLTVPLATGNVYDIRDCLDEYTKLEEIEGVQCPKCTLLSFKTRLEAISTDALKEQIQKRLAVIDEALKNEDFSDETVMKKCAIPKKQWVESTKTKQAVVARPPQSLVIHVNRSMFNEMTGAQIKNPAAVQFPMRLGLGPWTLGKFDPQEKSEQVTEERWSMEPTESMLPRFGDQAELASDARYELRAVVTHYGRHENGHYIAYRRHASSTVD